MVELRIICATCLTAFAFTFPPQPAAAARSCIFDWAVPGPYEVSGNFRGGIETVFARVTPDCRVSIALPGVYTGGSLKRSGRCLTFSFKVQDVRETFTARWCGDHGVVPWQGRNVQADVVRRKGRSNTGTK